MKLEGRVALITGAGSGIGAETARSMATEGAKIAVTGIPAEGVEIVTAELKAAGHEAVGIFVFTAGRSEGMVLYGPDESGSERSAHQADGFFFMAPIELAPAGQDSRTHHSTSPGGFEAAGVLLLVEQVLPESAGMGVRKVTLFEAGVQGKGPMEGLFGQGGIAVQITQMPSWFTARLETVEGSVNVPISTSVASNTRSWFSAATKMCRLGPTAMAVRVSGSLRGQGLVSQGISKIPLTENAMSRTCCVWG